MSLSRLFIIVIPKDALDFDPVFVERQIGQATTMLFARPLFLRMIVSDDPRHTNAHAIEDDGETVANFGEKVGTDDELFADYGSLVCNDLRHQLCLQNSCFLDVQNKLGLDPVGRRSESFTVLDYWQISTSFIIAKVSDIVANFFSFNLDRELYLESQFPDLAHVFA